MSWSKAILLLLLAPLLHGCGAQSSFDNGKESGEASDGVDDGHGDDGSPEPVEVDPDKGEVIPDPVPGPEERKICVAPEGVSNDPQKIEDVIRLLNAMPKPVSIACYLDVLKRPLHINATSSSSSVQPAISAAIPRIFIFSGSALIQTFVPDGEGSKVIEFSYLLNDTTSIKGELDFPVTGPLAETEAYTSILNQQGTGTSCVGCHGQETRAPGSYPDVAFSSKAFRPISSRNVSIWLLQEQNDLCEGQTSISCINTRALFMHGDVLPKDFPTTMSTLF